MSGRDSITSPTFPGVTVSVVRRLTLEAMATCVGVAAWVWQPVNQMGQIGEQDILNWAHIRVGCNAGARRERGVE